MSISDRLKRLTDPGSSLPVSVTIPRSITWTASTPGRGDDVDEVDESPPPSETPSEPAPATAAATFAEDASIVSGDPLALLKQRVQEALFRRLASRANDRQIGEQELHAIVTAELSAVLTAEGMPLSEHERAHLVDLLSDDVLGYGPIEAFLDDDSITEVMVNGLDPVYVERAGRLHETDVRFVSEEHLRQVIDRIVSRVGRRVDESSPMVDARLPDGSRVNAVIPPLAVDGPALTIRRFSRRALTADDLIQSSSITADTAELFSACVRGRLNILVTGGTGSGKTTLLNVLSAFIPDDQRIVTIEDAVELKLHQQHVIRLEARPPNIEGRGQVTIRDLMRNSLRMRPDRIIVGEVRSGEALDMLQAMNTGHDGSLSTLHANQPRDGLSRLETMVLMAGFDLPIRAIREQMASALDLIIHISRLRDGTRRVTHIVEVEGMEGDIITMTDLYTFSHGAEVDHEGRLVGELLPTGLRPKFADRLADRGVPIPARIIGAEPSDLVAAYHNGWAR